MRELSLNVMDVAQNSVRAEADLVKIVGREYVGLGVVADHAFCKVTF